MNQLEQFASQAVADRQLGPARIPQGGATTPCVRRGDVRSAAPASLVERSPSPQPSPPGEGEQSSRPSRPASLNPTRFLNRSEVRMFLLEHAKATRPANNFQRVSEEMLISINEAVRAIMVGRVHRAPSKGRTL